MTVSPVRNTIAENLKMLQQIKFGIYKATLAGTLTMVETFPTLNVLDPGGASRTVLLPAEASSEGLMFIIKNTADGVEDLAVKEDSNTTTIVTISQNEMGIVICDGTTWYGLTAGIT